MTEKIGSITSVVVALAQFSENFPVASVRLWSLIKAGSYSNDVMLSANAVIPLSRIVNAFVKPIHDQLGKDCGIGNILNSTLESLKAIRGFLV